MATDDLRFGVVGLGEFGELYVTGLTSLWPALGVRVTAVCSATAERARAIASRAEGIRWYTDAAELAASPEIDVVCVVTAEADHRGPVLAALVAEKDVIVEKPLATTLAEADEMIAAARRTGRQLLVGHLLRFEAMYGNLACWVHAGDLGDIVSLHTRRNRPAGLVGRYRRTHPVLETGILDLDVMLWLTRSRVVRVWAATRTVRPGPTPDLVWGMLEFESGAIGVLETSWLGPAAGIVTDDALSVIGTAGSARLDLSQAPLTIRTDDRVVVPDSFYSPVINGDVAGAFERQLLAFVRQLRQPGPDELVPLADVRHGLAVALAVIRSSEEGQAIATATAPAP